MPRVVIDPAVPDREALDTEIARLRGLDVGELRARWHTVFRRRARARLVAAIARGRRWLDEIVAGTVITVEQIAAREKCSIRQVHMTISLGFLAPGLVKAAIEGRLPRGIGVTRLRDAPAEWARQYAMLGLPI